MKRYGLLLNTGFLAALSFAAVSCLEDELVESRLKSDSNAIGFGISAATKADGASLSSAPHYADSSLLMLGNGGADTLYLHASYQNNLSTVSSGKETATRGVPVNSSNFSDACGNFAVSAFTPDGSPYMQNVRVDNLSGGIWSSDEKHFWPEEGDMALDFFACAPSEYTYGPEGSAVTVPVLAQDDIAFTTKDSKKLEFDYTVPGSESGVTNAAERQPDIMFAYSACSRDNSSAGSVPLEFYHALAGVRFVTKDISAGTVKSITLKKLYGAGKCTYVFPDGDGEPSITWNFDGQQQNASFSQEFNVKVNNQQTGEQPITDKAPETTFMMLPQDIENAEVEVLFNDGKTDYTLTGKLYDPSITSADNDTDLSTWDAGKIYTYAISTESINWTYVFEVSDNITFELGQTSEPYTVTSYRYRTQLGDKEENREPVPWTAANIGASETDPSNDKISIVDINDIVTAFTSNGDGSVNGAQSYTLGLVRGTLHTDYDGDKKLQDAEYKGSETDPYDLSTSGGLLLQETANCYAINAPGTYKLPLVYGNAIKKGSNNFVAYTNSAFTDYQGKNITDPYIYKNHGYKPHDACLVWSDGFYMFENVHLDEQKEWLIFSVNRDYMQQANAILAVRDEEGYIMWSWHIWVTERNLVGTAHTLQDWTSTSTTYGLLPCNLGWVDGKMVYYNSRELTYEFTQGTSGYKQTMLVNQAGAEFDYKDVGSTYYQWGRKDPIVALRNWDTYRFEDYRLHETSDPKYKYGIKPEQVPISTTIQNPNIYYTATNSNGTWNTNWCTSVISTLWDNSSNTTSVDKTTSVKTIYDPSPRGYKVPIPRAFSVFVKGSTYSGETGQNSINGYQIQGGDYNQYRVKPNRDGSGDDIPLTATGQRADREGLEAYSSAEGKISEPGGLWAMYGVYYWTSGQVNSNKNAGYSLCIRHDKGSNEYYYTYGFSGAKTMARPVRCIEDR